MNSLATATTSAISGGVEPPVTNLDDLRLSGVQERIVGLLGVGVTPTQVAAATGVSDSYISQLLSQPDIAAKVAALRTEKAAAHINHDNSLDSDEECARKLVRANLDRGFLRPMEALKHFQVLNAARRKSDTAQLNAAPAATVVNLQLPAAAAVQFKLTIDKQVIEVDGRSMHTMQSKQVTALLKAKAAAKEEYVEAATSELLESSLAPVVQPALDPQIEELLKSL